MSYNLKISVFDNVDYDQTFTLMGPNNLPLNLTGSKLLFGFAILHNKNLVTNTTPTTYVYDSSVSNPCISVVNAATGEIKLTLPKTILETLEAGFYQHNLILVDATAKRSVIWDGNMTIKNGLI